MTAERHRPAELSFAGPWVAPAPDADPLVVTFTHESGGGVTVPGFWDGSGRYRARFSAPEQGRWAWRTRSAVPELDGHSGHLDVGPAPQGVHGPVRVAGRFHFAHADGKPFRPVGATVYNWIHQDEALIAQTVEAVAAAGLNKLRFMVFPQAGEFVEHFPELLPFERYADGRWDVTRPVAGFFEHLEACIARLGARGIEAEVLVFNAYDNGRFGLDTLTEAQDATYLRYLVARLAAYGNVWWALCNEFDLLDETRTDERWTRAGELLADLDPYGHPRSIHNWVRLYDHNQPWVTHASLQLGQACEDFGRAGLFRDAYRKPVVLDEIKYEGDVDRRWGRLTAQQLVHQFWIATASGCYASHGESFVLPGGSLHIVEGGAFRGEAPARLGFLRRVLDEVPAPGLDPIDPWWDDAFVVGVPRQHYLQYLGVQGPAHWTFRLPQGQRGERLEPGDRFAVDVIDTWAMTITTAARTFTLGEVGRNQAGAVDPTPLELPAGRPVALRIRRVP